MEREREQGPLRTDRKRSRKLIGNAGSQGRYCEIPEGHGLGKTHNMISVTNCGGKKEGDMEENL